MKSLKSETVEPGKSGSRPLQSASHFTRKVEGAAECRNQNRQGDGQQKPVGIETESPFANGLRKPLEQIAHATAGEQYGNQIEWDHIVIANRILDDPQEIEWERHHPKKTVFKTILGKSNAGLPPQNAPKQQSKRESPTPQRRT